MEGIHLELIRMVVVVAAPASHHHRRERTKPVQQVDRFAGRLLQDSEDKWVGLSGIRRHARTVAFSGFHQFSTVLASGWWIHNLWASQILSVNFEKFWRQNLCLEQDREPVGPATLSVSSCAGPQRVRCRRPQPWKLAGAGADAWCGPTSRVSPVPDNLRVSLTCASRSRCITIRMRWSGQPLDRRSIRPGPGAAEAFPGLVTRGARSAFPGRAATGSGSPGRAATGSCRFRVRPLPSPTLGEPPSSP